MRSMMMVLNRSGYLISVTIVRRKCEISDTFLVRAYFSPNEHPFTNDKYCVSKALKMDRTISALFQSTIHCTAWRL